MKTSPAPIASWSEQQDTVARLDAVTAAITRQTEALRALAEAQERVTRIAPVVLSLLHGGREENRA